jgi:hypothetical protein
MIQIQDHKNDPEKQFIRELNFVAILSALYSIATQEFDKHSLAEYYSIPENDDNYLHLKIANLTIETDEDKPNYKLDIGIRHQEINTVGAKDYYLRSFIEDVGDLSTWSAYHELDATGLKLVHGTVFNEEIYPNEISSQELLNELLKGYMYFPTKNIKTLSTDHPAIFFEQSKDVRIPEIHPKQSLSFYLADSQDKIKYIILNGFVIDADNPNWPEYANGINIP